MIAEECGFGTPLELHATWVDACTAGISNIEICREPRVLAAVARKIRDDILPSVTVIEAVSAALIIVEAVKVKDRNRVPALAVDRRSDGDHSIEIAVIVAK
jgi:hypothetical protein